MISSISSRLQVLLNNLNWSQTRLAEEAKTHPPTVNRWITGKTTPSRRTLSRIAEITGCNLGWLQDGKGEMFSAVFQSEDWEEEQKEDYFEEDWDRDEEIERGKEIAGLLSKASTVLKFNFKHHTRCYSDSLAATINALYRAIRLEEKFTPKRGLKSLLERSQKGTEQK